MLTIRPAIADDLPVINEIYNHYVLNSTATYQTQPSTQAEREAWFAAHGSQHPVFVAELFDAVTQLKQTVGWASLNPFHARQAFNRTVENSVYIHPAHLRKGYGKALLTESIVYARGLHHHVIIAAIDGEQTPSIALHAQHGFVEVGRFKQVGFKFDRWLDVVYMQLTL